MHPAGAAVADVRPDRDRLVAPPDLLAVHEPDLLIALEDRDLTPELPRQPRVVVVQERDVPAAGLGDAAIARGRRAA